MLIGKVNTKRTGRTKALTSPKTAAATRRASGSDLHASDQSRYAKSAKALIVPTIEYTRRNGHSGHLEFQIDVDLDFIVAVGHLDQAALSSRLHFLDDGVEIQIFHLGLEVGGDSQRHLGEADRQIDGDLFLAVIGDLDADELALAAGRGTRRGLERVEEFHRLVRP